MRRSLVVLLAFASVAAFAQTYRWVDPATGKTVISDTPPPGKVKQLSKTEGANAIDDGQLPYAVRKAVESFPVVLYTTPDCAAECKQARDLLNGRGVPFTEKMVQKPEEFAELKQLAGDAMVPTLKVGRQPVRGFLAESYNNVLDMAGYPKTAPYGSKPSGGLNK